MLQVDFLLVFLVLMGKLWNSSKFRWLRSVVSLAQIRCHFPFCVSKHNMSPCCNQFVDTPISYMLLVYIPYYPMYSHCIPNTISAYFVYPRTTRWHIMVIKISLISPFVFVMYPHSNHGCFHGFFSWG